MSKHVKDIDKGFKAFQKFLKDAKELSTVNVGVLGSPSNQVKDEADGYTLVEIASVNEYGTRNQDESKGLVIPPRSFIASTTDEKKRSIAAMSVHRQRDMFLGKITLRQALGIMGEHIKNLIQDKITDLKDPPNKPSTIEKKGSSNPLIDTGRLRQSISYEVDKGSLDIL